MSVPRLKAAILVVSDTASRDASTDRAGDVLKETFATDERWLAPSMAIVPDSVVEIQRAVMAWADSSLDVRVNLVVTTGGTGFAERDVTPEAITPLIHRSAGGLVFAMLSASMEITPCPWFCYRDDGDVLTIEIVAMMSRPVAGVRHKTLIITLPGSPKGAKENLQAVLKFLPHACMQAAGENSRAAHVGGVKKLEADAGFSKSQTRAESTSVRHHHHHDHHHAHDHGHGGHKVPRAHTQPSERPSQSNDFNLGPTHRARSSPYPMLSVNDAVGKILQHSKVPESTKTEMTPALVGSVLSEDIYAAEAVPAYRASIVDGYAIIIPTDSRLKRNVKGTFPVASVSHAQASSMPPLLNSGEIARITTGAPLPENANAVVMVEDTLIASTTPDKSEEATVQILTDEVEIGENVREPGSDIKLGSLVLERGTTITSLGGEIGVLAAAGIRNVPIYTKPRVGVMSTGDEVTDILHDGTLQGGMIRDSNRPSLVATIRGWNLCSEVVDLGIAKDTPQGQLEEKIRNGYRMHNLDVIVTTGGVSMGELDLFKPTIERSMGGTIHFGRVNMKPGKPTTFATVPFKESETGEMSERLVFGLPGNPASAIVTAHLFLLPCLQQMAGKEGKGLERTTVRVADRVKCDRSRVEYHRVVVTGMKDGQLVAKSTGMQRSSRVGSLASANALLVLPQREEVLESGESCEALLMGPVLGFA